MMRAVRTRAWPLFLGAFCVGCSQEAVRFERAPSAFAGFDGTVTVGNEVVLDGSRSADPDGDPLTYRWAMVGRPEGSEAGLAQEGQRFARFVGDRPGTYLVTLVVSDGVSIDRDLVAITARPTSTTATDLGLELDPLCQAQIGALFDSPCGISDRRVSITPRMIAHPPDAHVFIEWSWLRLPPRVTVDDLSPSPAGDLGQLDLVIPRPGEYWIGARLHDGVSASPLVVATIAVFDDGVEDRPEPNLIGPRAVRRTERVLLDGRASLVPTSSAAPAIDRRFSLEADPSGEGRLQDVATGCPPGQCRLLYPSAPGTYMIGHQIVVGGIASGTVVHAVEVR